MRVMGAGWLLMQGTDAAKVMVSGKISTEQQY